MRIRMTVEFDDTEGDITDQEMNELISELAERADGIPGTNLSASWERI